MAERTCVSCRKTATPGELIRFVIEVRADVRVLCADVQGRHPGRGAYCHLRVDCLKQRRLDEALVASLTAASTRKGRGKKKERLSEDVKKPETPVRRRSVEELLRESLGAARGGSPQLKKSARLQQIEKVVQELGANPKKGVPGTGIQNTKLKRKIRI